MPGKKMSKKASKKASKSVSKKAMKRTSKKASKSMSKKAMKKSSKKASKSGSKKSSKKGSKKTQKGGREMNPSMKAFLELKTKIAKALNIPNGVPPAKIAGAINNDLKAKFPDAIERAKEAYKVFEADMEKYRKMLEK